MIILIVLVMIPFRRLTRGRVITVPALSGLGRRLVGGGWRTLKGRFLMMNRRTFLRVMIPFFMLFLLIGIVFSCQKMSTVFGVVVTRFRIPWITLLRRLSSRVTVLFVGRFLMKLGVLFITVTGLVVRLKRFLVSRPIFLRRLGKFFITFRRFTVLDARLPVLFCFSFVRRFQLTITLFLPFLVKYWRILLSFKLFPTLRVLMVVQPPWFLLVFIAFHRQSSPRTRS